MKGNGDNPFKDNELEMIPVENPISSSRHRMNNCPNRVQPRKFLS